MRFGVMVLTAGLLAGAPLYGAADLPVRMNIKVLTPNGDGINDVVKFDLINPSNSPSYVTIADTQGRRVVETAFNAPAYQWDGRDADGRIVESGLYLIQITQNDARWNGVILVAK